MRPRVTLWDGADLLFDCSLILRQIACDLHELGSYQRANSADRGEREAHREHHSDTPRDPEPTQNLHQGGEHEAQHHRQGHREQDVLPKIERRDNDDADCQPGLSLITRGRRRIDVRG